MPVMKKSFLLLLLFLLPFLSYSQYTTASKKAVKLFKEALGLFDRHMDEEALSALDKAIRADKNFIEAYMMRAQIFKDRGEVDLAVNDFKKALSINPRFYPPGYVTLASLQYAMGNYRDALENLLMFEKIADFRQISARDAAELRKKAEWAISVVQNPVPFNPVSLGDSVNSERNEYWPSLSLDEQSLIFTVLDPVDPTKPVDYGNMQEDFYISVKNQDGIWMKRKNAGPILNTANNEGAQCLSADGKTLYFTACNRPDGAGMCDLYRSVLSNGRWSRPVNVGGPVNTKFSEKHPSLSSDGKSLYFASDRPGSYGALDIWVSRQLPTGGWSEPVNLGDSINTAGNEQSPFIHPDNATLFFTSEGHLNLGKDDVFMARYRNGSWSKAMNLGYPVNTWNKETGLMVNAAGDMAYFSTDRQSGSGLDLYQFPLPPALRPMPVSYLKGKVYDVYTGAGLKATFQLINLEDGQLTMEVSSDRETGNFFVPLPAGTNYALNVSHPGYLFYSDHFSLSRVYEKTDPMVKDVPLNPIRSGEKTVLNNIFFDFDSAELKPESATELNKLLDFLVLNPGLQVQISGHTDNIGTDAYNKTLSERRAESVVLFLVNRGIPANRLSFEGFGAERPLESNDTETGRARNRRTEMLILK
jgi:outer membrane protein OmpA-like peptidoglycan-associated protein